MLTFEDLKRLKTPHEMLPGNITTPFWEELYQLFKKRITEESGINMDWKAIQSNKHPLPVDGICKCECNSTIREIYNDVKLQCTKCGGQVLANPSQNSENS